MNTFGIREGYTAREKPDYFHDVQPDGKIWQPDVLPIAVHIARQTGAKRLLDIGCGRGTKLIPYASEFEIIGVDFGDNIQYCRQNYTWGQWIECDLEKDWITVLGNIPSVVVCSDVIEHLIMPDHLIRMLVGASKTLDVNAVIVSTPDRLRTYGYDHNGIPSNPHHVREWTLMELLNLLQRHGMKNFQAGYTRSNNVDIGKNTSLVVLSNGEKAYNISGVFDLDGVLLNERQL